MIRDTLSEFVGKTPTGASFERLVQLVIECLPGDRYHWDTVEDSLRHLAGTFISAEIVATTAWRMAGNYKRLMQRRAVPPWSVQRFTEWVPMQCTGVAYEKRRFKMGAVCTFRILAGTSCPLFTSRWWSFKQCRSLLAEQFGFSRRMRRRDAELRYPYTEPMQFVTLRAYGLIDPEHCKDQPGFSAISFSPSVDEYNREQLKHRFRKDPGYICPNNYPATLPCHKCPIGFVTCRAACHKNAWVEKHCPGCARDNWFDPDSPSTICVDCTRLAAYKSE